MGLVEYIAQFFAVDNLQQVNYLVYFFNVVKFILLVHRYLAQQIIVCGNKPCMQTLDRNGLDCSVDLCGVQYHQLRTQKEHAIVHLGVRRLWRHK